MNKIHNKWKISTIDISDMIHYFNVVLNSPQKFIKGSKLFICFQYTTHQSLGPVVGVDHAIQVLETTQYVFKTQSTPTTTRTVFKTTRRSSPSVHSRKWPKKTSNWTQTEVKYIFILFFFISFHKRSGVKVKG